MLDFQPATKDVLASAFESNTDFFSSVDKKQAAMAMVLDRAGFHPYCMDWLAVGSWWWVLLSRWGWV